MTNDNLTEIPESVQETVNDLIGNIAFNSYVTLGAKFIQQTAQGLVYDREKHIKAFLTMEADFRESEKEGDDEESNEIELPPIDSDLGETDSDDSIG